MKALLPNDLMLGVNSNELRDVHPLKVLALIIDRVLGKVAVSKEVHPLNTPVPNEVIPLPKFTVVRLVHPSNAELGINLKVSGIVIDFKLALGAGFLMDYPPESSIIRD